MARPRKSREADPWKQRDRFIELVDQKVAEGVPLDEIAKAIGLKTANSLEKAYRYDHARIPKRGTIELAAVYFGVDPSEIYGPETDSDFGNVMGVLGRGLSLEWKKKLIEMAQLANIPAERAEVSHVVPLHEGGAHTLENIEIVDRETDARRAKK